MSDDTPEPTELEKRRRERDLLLTTFDPSEFGRSPNPVFTEPAEGSPVRDDVTPERMDAWLEKEQARLRETTGFDLSPEERPVSGEQPTEYKLQSQVLRILADRHRLRAAELETEADAMLADRSPRRFTDLLAREVAERPGDLTELNELLDSLHGNGPARPDEEASG